MNYALTDFRAVRIAFADLPSVDPQGSALGGTGIAVSAFGEAPAEAARFAQWVASGTVQRGLYAAAGRSEEHTSELQSLMRISYAVFCLKKKKHTKTFTQQLQPITTLTIMI